MKERRECKVVQDLLPNYVEKLTNEETNKYIEEHLETCEECKNVLENMKRKIEVPDSENQKKEVKFLKKYNRKLKILSGIILAAIIIYGIIVIRNVVILSSIVNKTNDTWNADNMHAIIYSHSGGKLSITEYYSLNDKHLMKYITYGGDKEIEKMISYYDENRNEMYFEQGENKVASLNSNNIEVTIVPHMYFSNSFELIVAAAINNITSVTCNGEECYYLSTFGEYFSKETGLSVRAINIINTTKDGTFDMVVDYKYEFGEVKEEDFVLPDISEYQLVQVEEN